MIVCLEILSRLELNQCIVHAWALHQILRAAVTETVFKISFIHYKHFYSLSIL